MKHFIKYALVGIAGTIVDLGSLYLLVDKLGLPVIPSSVLSFLLAVANNFILNKIWTFENTSKRYRELFTRFLIVSTIGLVLTVLSMWILLNLLGKEHYLIAKIITSGVVLTWNFLGNKLWTFSTTETSVEIYEHFSCYLSIIIPAYNEENRIKSTLLIIEDYLSEKEVNAEIIVVDDGSKDKTSEIVDAYAKKYSNIRLISHSRNHGKGYAVKTGIEAAQGRFVLFTDADNSTPIEEWEKLFGALHSHRADIAIGSRYLRQSKIHIRQPFYRKAMGRMANLLIQILLIHNIHDTQCGFKLFTHRAAKEIFALQKVRRFGFDVEALTIAKSFGYHIIEVPVSWFNSAESRVRPLKDALITLKDLLYIKFNLLTGHYNAEQLTVVPVEKAEKTQ